MEMSINQALAELKMLDKRITKLTNEMTYISYSVGDKPVSGYRSNEDYVQIVKSHYNKVTALIANRDLIKSKVVLSNAGVIEEMLPNLRKVTIGNVEMTVAEAIEHKTSIKYKKTLLDKLKTDRASAVLQMESRNAQVEAKVDQLLAQTYSTEKSKLSADQYDAVALPYKKNNEAKLVDPLNVDKIIEKLSEEIENFEKRVDFTLTEANVISKISVPGYEG